MTGQRGDEAGCVPKGTLLGRNPAHPGLESLRVSASWTCRHPQRPGGGDTARGPTADARGLARGAPAGRCPTRWVKGRQLPSPRNSRQPPGARYPNASTERS